MNVRARFVLPLVVAGTVFAGGCTSALPGGRGHQCTVGSKKPEAPIVCIDNTGTKLSVDPYRVVAFDEYPKNSGRPMVILFFTKTGTGNFKIIEKKRETGNNEADESCIAEQHCVAGEGLCRIIVPRLKDQKARVCLYDIEMAGFPPMDPEIEVRPCC